MKKADALTREERAEVDRRINADQVQRLPAGATSFICPVWNGHKLVLPEGTDYYRTKMDQESRRYKRRVAPPLPPDIIRRREQVAALHAEGLDTVKIVAALEIYSHSSIENDLRRLGLKANPYQRPDSVDWQARNARLAELAAKGLTYAEIAAELGFGIDGTSKMCRAAGIKVRRAGSRAA